MRGWPGRLSTRKPSALAGGRLLWGGGLAGCGERERNDCPAVEAWNRGAGVWLERRVWGGGVIAKGSIERDELLTHLLLEVFVLEASIKKGA